MTDAEFRIVSIVTRATFGWILNKKTGMRKEEDWISLSQMVEKSGKSPRAIKYAIQSCIEKRWIEVRGQGGELLNTGTKRQKYGRKLFYRLGPQILEQSITSATIAQVKPVQMTTRTSANDDTKPVQKKTVYYTKENLTKETLTKGGSRENSPLNGETQNSSPRSSVPTRHANRLAGIAWLKNVPEEEMEYFKEKFPQLPEKEIRNQAENASLWLEGNPGKRVGTKLFLKNWLDRTIKKEGNKSPVFHQYEK